MGEQGLRVLDFAASYGLSIEDVFRVWALWLRVWTSETEHAELSGIPGSGCRVQN